MSSGWKRLERLVAGWWGTCRNPLSGRNNVDDSGRRRLGDIVFSRGVIEVKRRQSLSFKRAFETRRLAEECGKPWAHYEFRTGQADMVTITLNFDEARYVSEKLRERWEDSHTSMPGPAV